MNWILLLILLYFSYKGFRFLFVLSDEDKKLWDDGIFSSVKSKEEIQIGCSNHNREEHNKNRKLILIRKDGVKYLKKI